MMKDSIKIFIAILLCVGAAAFFFDTCNTSQHSVKSDTVTVYKEKKIYVQNSPITIEKTTVRRLILSPAGGSVDSLFLKKTIEQKDSLRNELIKHKVKELLVLDTITKNRDTLHIAADCISAQMSVLMKFAPQQHTIQIPTTTITTTITEPATFWEKSLWFALGVGSGYMAHSLAQ